MFRLFLKSESETFCISESGKTNPGQADLQLSSSSLTLIKVDYDFSRLRHIAKDDSALLADRTKPMQLLHKIIRDHL